MSSQTVSWLELEVVGLVALVKTDLYPGEFTDNRHPAGSEFRPQVC